ncbi:MAG: hypothetical protein JWN70_2968 [Planctomycetaceae bacterium]|nr:hypothetical protein [Planctomycetaceae bacterium]
MKGPGLRNDLEIRRTFRCPQCSRTVLRLGDVVSQTCNCTDPPVWMLIQPDVKKPPFKFEKIEIPLTEEDLIIRDRPRRMPPPPPEGAPENDRRTARPKRPKPERRSFESFQEDLAAKVESEVTGGESIEAVEIVETTIIETTIIEAVAIVPDPETPTEPAPDPKPPVDEFGAGL